MQYVKKGLRATANDEALARHHPVVARRRRLSAAQEANSGMMPLSLSPRQGANSGMNKSETVMNESNRVDWESEVNAIRQEGRVKEGPINL